MKNLINEKPHTVLTSRLKRTFLFVDNSDIKNKKILDVGCGYGWFEYHALKKGANQIAGIEVSEGDLATVRKHIHSKKFTSRVGSAISIPFPDNSFDSVVAWEVIEHIPRNTEKKFFAEVYRVLRKGGAFYLSTPHSAFFSTYLDPAYYLINHRHYSRKQLSSYISSKKMKVEKIEVYGGIWNSLSLLNMYVAKWIFRREKFLQSFFAQKSNREYLNGKRGFFNIFCKYTKIG